MGLDKGIYTAHCSNDYYRKASWVELVLRMNLVSVTVSRDLAMAMLEGGAL